MNLVQQANFLEDVPKDQLINMSQEPSPQFPAFLVLSEIQRRTNIEKNYQAMLDQPTTTVAEEVVSNFAQPQLAQNQPTGLQAGAQQASLLPTSVSAGLPSAPASAPMQMAASGGITGYQNTGSTSLPDLNLAGYDPYAINPYSYALNPSANISTQAQGMTSAGEGLDNSRIEDVSNFFRDRYTMEDGSTDYATAAIDGFDALTTAAMVIPIAGWGVKGLGMGLSWAARAALRAFRSPRAKKIIQSTFTRPSPTGGKVLLPQTLQAGRNVPVSQVNKLQKLREFSPMRALFTAGLTGKALGGGYDYLTSPSSPVVKQPETQEDIYDQILNSAIAKNRNSGLFSDESEGSGQMDYKDMIRLGAGIMSAKNIGDIGTAVTDVLDAQDKRELLGLQGKFTQAQTEQIQANIEAMPKEDIRRYMQLILKGLEVGAYEDREKAILQYQSLSARLAELEGQETKPASEDANVIASYL